MKYLIILLLIFLTSLSFTLKDERGLPNFLCNTKWRISSHAFADSTINCYILNPVDSTEKWHWGSFVEFTNTSFQGYYSAPCGNDCFVRTSGKYKFIKTNTVFIDVIAINYSGFCSKLENYSTGFNAIFKCSSDEKGLIFTKE